MALVCWNLQVLVPTAVNANVHGRHESANTAELRLELDILPVFLVGRQCAEVGERNVNHLRQFEREERAGLHRATYVRRTLEHQLIAHSPAITPANSMTPRALLQPRTQHNSASTQIHLVFYHYCHFRVPGTVAVGLRVIC